MGMIKSCCVRDKNRSDSKTQADLKKLTLEEKLTGETNETVERKSNISYGSNMKRAYLSIPSDENNSYIVVVVQILSRLAYFRDFLNIMGKAVKDKSNFLKDFIILINCLSNGEACEEEFETIIEEFRSFEKKDPITIIEKTLCKIHFALYKQELSFVEYKLNDEDTSPKSLNELKERFSQEFNYDLKNKFYTGFLNIKSKNCKNVKCGFRSIEIRSETFSVINMSQNETSLQDDIDNRFTDRQLEGKCDKCNKESNTYITLNKVTINTPKYLFIKVGNTADTEDVINYRKQPLRFLNKNYELFSIIHYSSENEKLYSCTIKIDYKWVSFKEDYVALAKIDENYEDCFAYVFHLK